MMFIFLFSYLILDLEFAKSNPFSLVEPSLSTYSAQFLTLVFSVDISHPSISIHKNMQ